MWLDIKKIKKMHRKDNKTKSYRFKKRVTVNMNVSSYDLNKI